MTSTTPTQPRVYDIIGYGDEVPGILALVSASRAFQQRTQRKPRLLLMIKGASQQGVGGHLVRGGLAYLDRSFVPVEIRKAHSLPTFGDPCALYKEFLQRSQVKQIALNPDRANTALRAMLQEAGVDLISQVEIQTVLKDGARIRGIQLKRGETYLATQFIDATVNAELAQAAGVPKWQGWGSLGLPNSELPVTLVFETKGITPQRLKEIELNFLRRYNTPTDKEAQNFLRMAAGQNDKLMQQFQQDMQQAFAQSRTLVIGEDFIDARCRALSIAFHSYRGKACTLKPGGFILDQPNIAILEPDRLSWNALLFATTGAEAETLARGAAKPTATMLAEIPFVERWFKSLGATSVKAYPELYIRHAGNVRDVVAPLSSATMMRGGVPAAEALGTFGYHLDVRGGIDGLGMKAKAHGITNISVHQPTLFNVGIHHTLIRGVPNLAVVSPGSGFEDYGAAAGRIIEFNAAVGQGVGIAMAIALVEKRHLATVTNAQVRKVLDDTKQITKIYGQSYPEVAMHLDAFNKLSGSSSAIA